MSILLILNLAIPFVLLAAIVMALVMIIGRARPPRS
jgi:hypothetical protein